MPDDTETGNTEAGNTESAVLREVTGPVAVLTLNRPKARNALDDTTRETLRAELEALNANADVRVVILTGAGSAFCAGGDIKGMQQRLEQPPGQVAINGWRRQHHTGAFVTTLANCEQITIAAVNGPAMGLGMDIALACDFIVAAPEAKFAASFVKRGLIPDGAAGEDQLLGQLQADPPRQEVQAAAVGAEEALHIGLADRLAQPGELLATAREFAAQFTENSRPALALMKSIVNRSFETSFELIAAQGRGAQAISYTTDEHRSSVEKFLNRLFKAFSSKP
jgi:2-(1,2-epoxy-1,2-dihydrophenyl)acetyl-CoA isomerase